MKKEALLLLLVLVLVCVSGSPAEESIKVYFDQDVMIASSNILSLAMLLRHSSHPNPNRRIEVVGVGAIGGDSHIEDALHHALNAVELCGTPDIPVAQGAGEPYYNSKEHVFGRLGLFGPKGGDNWLGEWGDFAPPKSEIRKIPGFENPKVSPSSLHASLLLIDLARKYEGQLVVVTAGPLTNIAMAVRLAPDIVPKIKAIYTMASAIHVRSKFNFWWDPESAAVVLRQNWTKKVMVPIDVCQQTKFTPELFRSALPRAPSPYKQWLEAQFDQHFAEFHLPMWDELLVAILFSDVYGTQDDYSFFGNAGRPQTSEEEGLLLDKESRELVKKETSLEVSGCQKDGTVVVRPEGPLVERRQEEPLVREREKLYLDVDCMPGPHYGSTLWWEGNDKMKDRLPGWLQGVEPWDVITTIHNPKFEQIFASILSSGH